MGAGGNVRLLSADWVVPIVAPPVRDGALALDGDGVVLAVGARREVVAAFPGAVETRAEGALLPGLVNAHAHLELSAAARAGMVPGGSGGVVGWTRRLAERIAEVGGGSGGNGNGNGDEEMVTEAVRAVEEARGFGTVAIGDVGNGTAGWRALGRAGMAGVFFHELVGSREARTGDALADAATERTAVPGAATLAERVPAVPAPHAPYSVGPQLMRRIFRAAEAAGRPTSIHLAEDRDEIALLAAGTGAWADVLGAMGVDPATRAPGTRPVAYLDSQGAFTGGGPPPLLVHMVEADADDRRRACAAGATVVLCPRSNLHVVGRLPDVPALLHDGVRLALGTDSLAAVPDLSPWAEISVLAARFPDVPPRAWLAAATSGGAAALRLPRLGALVPGRRPGVIEVSLRLSGGGAPDVDPERALVCDPHPNVRWRAAA